MVTPHPSRASPDATIEGAEGLATIRDLLVHMFPNVGGQG
jgi:hypothetical protein